MWGGVPLNRAQGQEGVQNVLLAGSENTPPKLMSATSYVFLLRPHVLSKKRCVLFERDNPNHSGKLLFRTSTR